MTLPGSGTATFQCDGNGNVVTGTLTSVTGNAFAAMFDVENHPTSISRTFVGGTIEPCIAGAPSDTIFCDGFEVLSHSTSGGATSWAYDSSGRRDYESSSAGARFYGPAGYEQLGSKKVHELGPVIVTRTGSTDAITLVLRDRLGSTLDTIDGTTLTQRAFDAFGKARNGDLSDRPNGTLNLADTIHGFTSHTHADDVAIVHMNGRVFDPSLGRFLSVDPIISGTNSQAANAYSYLGNNPLSGKDPSGFEKTCGTSGSQNPGSSNSACSDVGTPPETANRIDGFQVVYQAPSSTQSTGSGVVGQSVEATGGTQNAKADAPDQMALNNSPTTKSGDPPPTLDTITVTANANTGTNDANGWIPAANVTWNLYYAERAQFNEDYEDRATKPVEDMLLGWLLGPLNSPLDLGRGIYEGDQNRARWGAVGIIGGAVPDVGGAAALLPEIRGGLNLFKSGAETTTAANGWRQGDYMLFLPNQGSPAANWAQNSGRLRQVMSEGNPIFDSYRNPASGTQIPAGQTPTSPGRFLRAERELLENRGWQYNAETGAYHPPQP